MTSAILPSGAFYGVGQSRVSAGVSEAARQSVFQFKRSLLDKWRTASGQGAIFTTLPALDDSYREAEAQAQYGEQLMPSAGAMHEARELLEALPTWCSMPTPLIEPSGTIAFEWDLGPNRWMVLALKGTGTIEHSAILGRGNELWGTRNFAGTLGEHERRLLQDLMQLKA